MSRRGPWPTLGIDPTQDAKLIRKAYADRLRNLDIDREPDAYARLRQARDEALHLSRTPSAPSQSDELVVNNARGLEVTEGLAPEPAEPAELPPTPEVPLQPRTFNAILFPGGEASDTPLSQEEYDELEKALDWILDDITAGNVDYQQGGETWIAEQLAMAWPRSAPVVERVAQAFDWERVAGQLNEHPAIAFINARIASMHFHLAVEHPSHPLHGAWQELQQSGPKPGRIFGGPRKNEVNTLLATIRGQHPELESLLDWERIASWESQDSDSSWGNGIWLVVALGIAPMLSFCSKAISDVPAHGQYSQPPPIMAEPPPIEVVAQTWTLSQRREVLEEILGEGVSLAAIQSDAPEIWNIVERLSGNGGTVRATPETAKRQLETTVRLATQMAATNASYSDLVEIKQIKMELMQLAQENGGTSACWAFFREAALPAGMQVPPALRERERALARRLLENGDFRDLSGSGGAARASIPPELFEAAREQSGLQVGHAEMAAELQGSDSHRCRFRLALLDQALRRPGTLSVDFLRIL